MKVHHLICGTMCPPLARLLVNAHGHMVCHCLLCETRDGLLLVDTGLGLEDLRDPVGRMGRQFNLFARPVADERHAAAAQIERLGFSLADVRHIIPTHLDTDHAGGLPDFPQAKVHVFEPEHAAAMARATAIERERYRPVCWRHGPRWELHEVVGERFMGLDAVRPIAGLADEVALVPLVGHTRGHCGVAIRSEQGWLLHAGDAYFHRDEMHPTAPRCTPGLALFQRIIAMDDDARRHNQRRLRALANGGDVTVFSAHDPSEVPG